MPDIALQTPTGVDGLQWQTSQRIEEYLYDPAVSATTLLTNGMVVFISGGYSAGADQTSVTLTNVPVIRKVTTTVNNNLAVLGVVTNAPTTGTTVGYAPGQIVQVVVGGLAQVLCDANNTTYGQYLVLGTTTAGAATAKSTSTEGQTVARCVQTATIASGTALVFGIVGIF